MTAHVPARALAPVGMACPQATSTTPTDHRPQWALMRSARQLALQSLTPRTTLIIPRTRGLANHTTTCMYTSCKPTPHRASFDTRSTSAVKAPLSGPTHMPTSLVIVTAAGTAHPLRCHHDLPTVRNEPRCSQTARTTAALAQPPTPTQVGSATNADPTHTSPHIARP